MGSAAQKSSRVDVCVHGSPKGLAAHDAVDCVVPDSPVIHVSRETSTGASTSRSQRAPQATATTTTAPPQLGPSWTTSHIDYPSARPHLSAPRSPLSISRLSGDSPGRRTPSRHFVRRPTLIPLTATTTTATNTTATMSNPNTAGAQPPFNELNLVVTPLRKPTVAESPATTFTAPAARTPSLLMTTAAVLAAGGMSASPASPNSSCSAFSLYSAESSLREIPALPSHLLASETILYAASPAGAAPVPRPLPPPLTPVETARAGSRPTATATPVEDAMAQTAVQPRTAVAVPQAPTSAPTSAALTPLPAPPSPLTTSASAPPYANFLLEMSFDSRVLVAGAASATAEIHRIGTRLQRYQRGPAQDSPSHRVTPAVSFANPSPLCDAALTTSTAAIAPMESSVPPPSPQPPLVPMPAFSAAGVAEPTTATTAAAAAATAGGDARGAVEPLFLSETVKFVDMIQRLQRAREAGRVSYTWFRPAALQASEADFTKSSSSATYRRGGESSTAGDGEDLEAVSDPAPSRSSSCDNAQSSSGITGRGERQEEGEEEEEEDRGVADLETERRASMRRRDRLPTLIHWVPYESYECDPMTPLKSGIGCCGGFPTCASAGAASSCGGRERRGRDCFAVAAPPADAGAAAAATGHGMHDSRGDNEGAARRSPATLSPLLPRADGMAFNGTDTPPLPTVLHVMNPTKPLLNEGKKLSPVSADASGPNMTTSTAPGNSVDSLSHCPLHGGLRPPSIYIMHHWERSRSTAGSSTPVKRQHLTSSQVAVPASAVTTPRPSATPLPAAMAGDRRVEGRWNDSNSNSSSSHSTNRSSPGVNDASGVNVSSSGGGESVGSSMSARRAIIDGGVPFRKQLAKKALEDNKLFFEFILRRQKSEVPHAKLLSPPAG